MADDHHRQEKPTTATNHVPPPNPKVAGKIGGRSSSYPHKIKYPNPTEETIPDPATLREQWRYAIRQYSKWYSHAWGTAILAGVSFFALGWVIKGGNPIPSFHKDDDVAGDPPPPSSNSPEVNRTH